MQSEKMLMTKILKMNYLAEDSEYFDATADKTK